MTFASTDLSRTRGPAADRRPERASRACDIDTLRGLACLALVSFHVVGYTPRTGLELPQDHWLPLMNAALADMRMPLFSFLSGYVFVMVSAGAGLGGWIRNRVAAKARRLLLPMLTVSALFWLARTAQGQAQPPLWSIAVLPYAHFWYLQATFLIMAAFLALAGLNGGRGTSAALALLLGGWTLWIALPRLDPNLFSVADALRLSGFFAAGYLAAAHWSRIDAVLPRRWQRALGAGLLAALVLAGALRAQGGWSPAGPMQVVPVLVIGLGSCMALLLLRPRIAALAWLGPYSYAIYLFHVFFTAGSREMLSHLLPGLAPGALWALGLLAGVLGPVAVHLAALRHPLGATALLGLRWRPGPARPGGTASRQRRA